MLGEKIITEFKPVTRHTNTELNDMMITKAPEVMVDIGRRSTYIPEKLIMRILIVLSRPSPIHLS